MRIDEIRANLYLHYHKNKLNETPYYNNCLKEGEGSKKKSPEICCANNNVFYLFTFRVKSHLCKQNKKQDNNNEIRKLLVATK